MARWLGTTLVRLVVFVVVTSLCFLPLELFLLLTKALNPTGFWEKFATLGIGLWIGGGIQFVLFVVWVFCMYWLTFGWNQLMHEVKRPVG